MKKLFITVVLCVVVLLCFSVSASGEVFNIYPGGVRVVYDTRCRLYWYPSLTDTIGMTRAQQEGFIAGINVVGFAGIGTWEMATSEQTQCLKDSLAENGEVLVEHAWPWVPPEAPRNMGSPFLAYSVQADMFFTPTSVATQPLMPGMPPILGGLPMQVFNGRTTGAWWRTDVPTTPYSWEDGEADDHFVTSEYMTPGEYATMTFNYDVHYLSDDATSRDGFPGPFGAWIVSTQPSTLPVEVEVDIKPQSCPNPLDVKDKGVLPVAVLGTAEFDVTMIDPASVKLEGVEPLRWSMEDVATPVSDGTDVCACTEDGPDGYNDLSLKFDAQAILASLGDVADGEVVLLTLTADYPYIMGSDCVVIRAKGKKPE